MNRFFKISMISLASIVVAAAPCRYAYRVLCRAVLLSRLPEKKVVLLWPKRGDIYDRDGNIILTTETVYDVRLDTALPEDSLKWAEGAVALAAALDTILPSRSGQEWLEYLDNGRAGNRYLLIARQVSQSKRDSLRKLPLLNIFEPHDRQVYPYGELARRTLGYSVHRENGHVGLAGRYHEQLQGIPAERTVCLGWVKGRRRHIVTGQTERVPASNLYTTLDMRLQAVADSALRVALAGNEDFVRGCIVLMEVPTGAIRAIVNLDRSDSDGGFHEYYNAVIGGLHEPGEVVEVMTQAALISDGVAGKSAAGYYASQPQRLTDAIRSFCLPDEFGRGRDFDLPGLAPARITEPDSRYWSANTVASLAEGHSLAMVPLDILSFYNTIARGGSMVEPYLVDSLSKAGETTTRHKSRILRENVLSPAVADMLARTLRETALSGTAAGLADARHPVAGKAGSSRQAFIPSRCEYRPGYTDSLGRHQMTTTFAGFFPSDAPMYSVICVIWTRPTHNHYYGKEPAMVVKEVVNAVDS